MTLGTVLFTTPYYAPHVGGTELYVQNLVTELLDQNLVERAVVVTGADPDRRTGTVTDGQLTVHRLPTTVTLSRTPLGAGWPVALRRLLRAEQPDVVCANAPVPGLADLTAAVVGRRQPFVLTYHAGPMRKQSPLLDAGLAAYEKHVLSVSAARADRIVCSSAAVRDAMIASFPLNPEVVHPGVELLRFRPTPPPAANRLLFVGSLDAIARYKGLDTLLEAMVLLRRDTDVTLEVVGDGTARGSYEAQAAELGVADVVRFSGQLGRDALAEAYRRNDVFVLPTRYDSTPTVVVEAMASGRPVVASRVGGVPEAVEDGVTGLLVPPGDPAAVADRLRRLLDDPGLARRMGEQGRARAETRFGWPGQAAITAAVYADAIAERASRVGTGTPPRRRVAVVASHYAPQIGGLETYTRTVVGALRDAEGVEPLVFTAAHGSRVRHDVVDDVHVVRLGTWLTLSNTPINPLWPIAVRRALRRHRVDVVNTHAPVPGLADVATFVAGRRPVVATYHAGSMRKGRPRVDAVLSLYERFVLPSVFRRAAARIAVSTVSLAWSAGGAELVSPGVDLATFHPEHGAERPPRTPGTGSLLYVGRIERSSAWKGVHVLVGAFARLHRELPDTRLRLVGTGDAVPDITALAHRLGVGDAVELVGALTGADLAAAYRAADVVVLPSLTPAESFGMVLVEAMACGRPVIGSRVGGIPGVIEEGVTGLLVPPGDEDALAGACRRLLQDPSLAEEFGRNGAKRAAERFGWEDGMRRTVGLLRSVTHRRRGR